MPTILASSISDAWKKVVSSCLDAPGHEIYGLTVEIGCDEGTLDDLAFRKSVSKILIAENRGSVDTVARTIFPIGLWNPEAPRSDLYKRYTNILQKLRKCPLNRRGIYFERLIDYHAVKKGKTFTNQLEFIINTYVGKRNHRRSALQACLYNPFIDASHSRRLGFPCLQQIAFIPNKGRELTVLAFYPVHYIFERAYGNYLGLAHLGGFMAKEMGLHLVRVICTAGVAQFEAPVKKVRSLKLS
jgi:hypothetical protein